MKLLLIHQTFTTPADGGGTRHYEFATRFVSERDSFVIVTSDRSYMTGEARDRSMFDPSMEKPGLEILPAYTTDTIHRGKLGRVISLLSFMVSSFLRALSVRSVDVVIGTSPPIFQAFSAWLVSALKNRPFVLEVRDLWPEFLIDMGLLKNRFLIRLFKWMELFLYNRACHIIVNSPAYREYLLGQKVGADKITIIPNGVDVSMFNPDEPSAEFRERNDLNGSFVVTYAGALGPSNDIETILDAASVFKHDNIKVLLIGSGISRNHLETLAKQRSLTNVRFLGSIPKSEISSALAASDACVATLKNIEMFKTTYPNKVFDYMAAGRPTVLAIDGVIREVIENAKGGVFVPPGDSTQLAKAILDLYKDRTSCSQMGRNARDYVVKHFNRDDQATCFNELIYRLSGKISS